MLVVMEEEMVVVVVEEEGGVEQYSCGPCSANWCGGINTGQQCKEAHCPPHCRVGPLAGICQRLFLAVKKMLTQCLCL